MSISKYRLFFALMSLIVVLSSCQEVIELDLNEGDAQRLVVNGWMTDQPGRQRVDLSLTTSYFFNEAPPRVSDAVVSVTDGTDTWVFTEDEPGTYRPAADVVGEAGKTYVLNIEYAGETYNAAATLRASNPMDSIYVRYFDPLEEFGFPADPYYSVRLWTEEPEGEGDAYLWYTFVNGFGIRDTLRELTLVEDSFYDGALIEDLEIDFVDIGTEAVTGDTLRLEQWNIGLESYEVLNSILNQTEFQGGLFDAPPANVQTNLSNGALGLWGAASIVEKSTIITE
ncbi:MAG: DUF4249 domain-containing protein [Flavobacteriales bacterium]|jgi:hypothetical protein|nr:DUF4249 domain-containing protein [Flavobacteriales bacterium]